MPVGNVSEGGYLEYVLNPRIKAGFQDQTISSDERNLEYGKSKILEIKIQNNTAMTLNIKINNREDKSSAIAIHGIYADFIKIKSKKDVKIEVLLYGRKLGIFQLKNLKITNSANNKTITYEPLELEVYG